MINGQIAIIAICPFSYYMYKIFRTYKENAMSWINIADITYPIGSYYISNNNTPPAEIFEGSWERVEGGLCLTSIGSYTWTSTDLTDSSGAILATTGGSMGGRMSITTSQMPAHEGHLLSNTGNNGIGKLCGLLKKFCSYYIWFKWSWLEFA